MGHDNSPVWQDRTGLEASAKGRSERPFGSLKPKPRGGRYSAGMVHTRWLISETGATIQNTSISGRQFRAAQQRPAAADCPLPDRAGQDFREARAVRWSRVDAVQVRVTNNGVNARLGLLELSTHHCGKPVEPIGQPADIGKTIQQADGLKDPEAGLFLEPRGVRSRRQARRRPATLQGIRVSSNRRLVDTAGPRRSTHSHVGTGPGHSRPDRWHDR